MKFAIIGLGRMGLSLGALAVKQGHEVTGWDPDDSAREAGNDAGLRTVAELQHVPELLDGQRVLLIWVPQGKVVDDNLELLVPLLEAGDVSADCGNSFWEDSRLRHDLMADNGVHFLDIGTSHGSVIRSWLVELMDNALSQVGVGPMSDIKPDASNISTFVEDTDEVKWVIHWAMEQDIPTPVTVMSQQMLMAYRDLDWPAAKSVALLRRRPCHPPGRRRRASPVTTGGKAPIRACGTDHRSKLI